MSQKPSKRTRAQFGGTYRDRIPLEEDFEVVKARTASLSGPNSLPMQTEYSSIGASWSIGTEWAIDDSHEYSLDPHNGWYDEALEVDIGDLIEELAGTKAKKTRSQASV